MCQQGIQTKNFRHASRESLSLSFIFNTFSNVTLYVLAGYSDRKFSPCFARKSKFKFHLQHFSECHALCFSRVFNTFPNVTLYVLAGYSIQKFSPRFARKPKFKIYLQHFSERHALCFSRLFRPKIFAALRAKV